MARDSDDPSFLEKVDLSGDFPDIDDVEGYVEQVNYYDHSRTYRTYFYLLGNTVSVTFVPCADVDCEGAYFVKDIIIRAYSSGKKHMQGTITCGACKENGRKGRWCKAKYSLDIKYRIPAQEPEEGPAVPSPEDRYDIF